MKIIILTIAVALIQVQGYTVSEFNACLTKNCGEIACWKANDSAKCNKLKSAYEDCVSTQSEACTAFNKEWTAIENQETAEMISYGSCFSDCESKLENDDYLYYHYKCYSQCADKVYSSLLTFSIATILTLLILI